MKRGRPTRSIVRQNIVEILANKPAYGYEIYKIYTELFPPVTLRLIYYHLRKGLDLQEFQVEETKREQGEYSWGSETEKTYYTLGPNAKPKGERRVSEFFKK